MKRTEQLRAVRQKIQTIVMTGSLAMAAIAAQGNTNGENYSQKDKQQMFELAVRAGTPKTEIVKYMDFPEFIPVTSEGQFDREKADEWGEKLTPYLKTLSERGKTMEALDAYEVFKETTGQKNVSQEDFERVCKIAKEASENCEDKWKNLALLFLMGLIMATIASGSGCKAYEMGKAVVKDVRRKDFNLGSGAIAVGSVGLGVLSACTTALTGLMGYGINLEMRNSPKCEIRQMYHVMYNTYIDDVVKEKKQQIQQTEWAQVQKILQNGGRK